MKENYQVSSFPNFIIQKKECTKFEQKFFKASDHCTFKFDFQTTEFSFEKMKTKLCNAFNQFKKEIVENITVFSDHQKETYLARLTLRIEGIRSPWISVPDQKKSDGQKIKISINGKNYASEFDLYCKRVMQKKNELKKFIQSLSLQSHINKEEKTDLQRFIKPIINPKHIPSVLKVFEDHLTPDDLTVFENLLRTGEDAQQCIIFMGNGNRLADAFKQLFNAGLILRYNKKELQKWICRNFKYLYRAEIKDFKYDYLNKLISGNDEICQNPILNVSKERNAETVLIKKI